MAEFSSERRKELETSATSLNRQSWMMEEPESRDTTPLIRKVQRPVGSSASAGGSGQGELGKGGGAAASASYSAILDSEHEGSLFVTRALYGEVVS